MTPWWSAAMFGARFAQFASAALLFGWPCFCSYCGPVPRASGACAPRATFATVVVLLVASVIWAAAETAALGDEPSAGLRAGAVWQMLSDSRFGRAALLRMMLCAFYLGMMAMPRVRRSYGPATVLGASMLATFAWSGHAAAGMGVAGAVRLGADVMHLLAAGLWLGALPPLTILAAHALRSGAAADADAAQAALARFSQAGLAAVALLAASGMVNAWYLFAPAGWQALYSTPYGITLCVKLMLFFAMLLLASNHRLRLMPRLREGGAARRAALRGLKTGLPLETALGFLVLAVVALLGSLPPPGAAD